MKIFNRSESFRNLLKYSTERDEKKKSKKLINI